MYHFSPESDSDAPNDDWVSACRKVEVAVH